MQNKFLKGIVASLAIAVSGVASAGIITGAVNIDNGHSIYLSTDDNVQGDLISSAFNWVDTDTFSANLDAGTDYYLHIAAVDVGVIAGVLGEFNLTGNDHVFSNGSTEVLTNTQDWSVSSSGWNNYVDVTYSNGTNGTSPWGLRSGVDSNAEWIWSADNCINCTRYFSLAITATAEEVPEPSTIAIFALGIMGLLSRRNKKLY